MNLSELNQAELNQAELNQADLNQANPNQTNSAYPPPQRLSFPASEMSHKWLCMLIESYFTADKGVFADIARMEKKGRKLACAKGCSSCCRTHVSIPVYPIELAGMSWYAVEKVKEPVRAKLIRQIKEHTPEKSCLFLVVEVCSVHPVRPLACRFFNVFGNPCDEGEDAYYTRRKDVMTPSKQAKNEALKITLPFYGIKDHSTKKWLIKQGGIHRMAREMRACDWHVLADKMEDFDKGESEK